MFLQVALDIGVVGLCGYLLLLGGALLEADRAARRHPVPGCIAEGAAMSIIMVHCLDRLTQSRWARRWAASSGYVRAWFSRAAAPAPSQHATTVRGR